MPLIPNDPRHHRSMKVSFLSGIPAIVLLAAPVFGIGPDDHVWPVQTTVGEPESGHVLVGIVCDTLSPPAEARPDSDTEAFHDPVKPDSLAVDASPPSRAEVTATLRMYLLDLHGSSRGIVAYAERLENERGFPKEETSDILLELAGTDSYSLFGRSNAIHAFVHLADKDCYDKLENFYSVTNASLRTATQMAILYALSTTSERLAYAKERFDWLANHPAFQSDVSHFGCYFQGFLNSANPTESEKRVVVDFFWNAATNAAFFECAHEAEMLLLRYDPAWPTNEARRAMMEKWKDDPGMHEKTRALWNEALAAFGGPDAAVPPESSGPAICVVRPFFEPASTNSAADAESPLPPLENDNTSTTSPDNSSGVCESLSSAIFIILSASILTGLVVAVRRVSKRRRRGLRLPRRIPRHD